ncbi:C40 family peptidase [Lysobacter sp. A6]|uniref:C40 family peptidase n=1 Tax=Noviluteimonas lactosilytica TaxID=2888523 RepID=A0ABS8JF26_9GAMM|nr:C40 family peptidase [Lysobacter lactosilyticus]
MTTQDLTTGLTAATRTAALRVRAGAIRFLFGAALCVCATTAFAQEATDVAGPLEGVDLELPVTTSLSSAPAPKVRPIFGDLAELDPNATLDQQAKPKLTERISNVMGKALTLLGTPYRWGGESTDGFDCSGLVGYVYRTVLGMDLPRVSRQMATTGEAVERSALVPGDLVFFGRSGRVSHVGIYMGEGRFLHAPSRGKNVRVDSLVTGYWSNRYMQGRRVAM